MTSSGRPGVRERGGCKRDDGHRNNPIASLAGTQTWSGNEESCEAHPSDDAALPDEPNEPSKILRLDPGAREHLRLPENTVSDRRRERQIPANWTARSRIAYLQTVLYGTDIIPVTQRQYRYVWKMRHNRLGPTEWVNAGLKALARFGFAALKADTLANRLRVSRGSFYWHFAHVSAFHAAILSRWREVALEKIIAEVEGTADDRLEALLTRAFGAGSALSAPCAPGRPSTRKPEPPSKRWTASAYAIARAAGGQRRSRAGGRNARSHHELGLSGVCAVVETPGRRVPEGGRQGTVAARTLEI